MHDNAPQNINNMCTGTVQVWIWLNTLISIISSCIKSLTTNSDADFTTSLKTLMYDCFLLPLKRESEAEQI